MNLVAQQFAKQKSTLSAIKATQNFLNKFLQHLTEYFRKTSGSLTEQKANFILRSLTSRMHEYFPEDDFMMNVCAKAISLVKLRIDDVRFLKIQKKFAIQNQEDNAENENQKIDEVMKNIARKVSKQKQETKRSIDSEWLKKTVLDEITTIKMDLVDNERIIQQQIIKVLKSLGSGLYPLNCLLFDSGLNNFNILENAAQSKDIKIKISVVSLNKTDIKANQVDLKSVSNKIRFFDVVFISGDSILQNGNILAPSGTLMTVLAAKMQRKPIYVISRGFCLTEKVMLDHKILQSLGNPLQYFKQEQIRKIDRIYLGKKYDLIESNNVKFMITEFGLCEPANVPTIFEEYYEKL